MICNKHLLWSDNLSHNADTNDYIGIPVDGAIPVIFQAGQNCTTVVVSIVNDEFWESDVFFGTTLNSTCNSTTITQNNAVVLIKDDDGMFVSDDVSYVTFNYMEL